MNSSITGVIWSCNKKFREVSSERNHCIDKDGNKWCLRWIYKTQIHISYLEDELYTTVIKGIRYQNYKISKIRIAREPHMYSNYSGYIKNLKGILKQCGKKRVPKKQVK